MVGAAVVVVGGWKRPVADTEEKRQETDSGSPATEPRKVGGRNIALADQPGANAPDAADKVQGAGAAPSPAEPSKKKERAGTSAAVQGTNAPTAPAPRKPRQFGEHLGGSGSRAEERQDNPFLDLGRQERRFDCYHDSESPEQRLLETHRQPAKQPTRAVNKRSGTIIPERHRHWQNWKKTGGEDSLARDGMDWRGEPFCSRRS